MEARVHRRRLRCISLDPGVRKFGKALLFGGAGDRIPRLVDGDAIPFDGLGTAVIL